MGQSEQLVARPSENLSLPKMPMMACRMMMDDFQLGGWISAVTRRSVDGLVKVMSILDYACLISKRIADGDYADLEAVTSGVRLSAQMMQDAVSAYGKVMTEPSEAELAASMDVVECEGLGRRTWSVRFPLWTVEEGRSDLSVECTVFERGDGSLAVALDDIHVL